MIRPGQVWVRRDTGQAVVVVGVTGWKVVYRGQRQSSSDCRAFARRFKPVIGESGPRRLTSAQLLDLWAEGPAQPLMVRLDDSSPLFLVHEVRACGAGGAEIDRGLSVVSTSRRSRAGGTVALAPEAEVEVLFGALVGRGVTSVTL